MNWLSQIAPTIATCLGGPLAGMGVALLEKVLGISSDKVMDAVNSGKLTSDQVAQIKVAEIELKKQEEQLGLNFEQLAVEDRKSARDMQVGTKSKIPSALAILVTIGFFGILVWLMIHPADTSNTPLMIMLGSLGTAWSGIIAFYFGSSASSHAKDEMIYNSTPSK